MRTFDRREFLVYSAKLAAMMGLGASAIPRMVEAFEKLSAGDAPVLWLQGQSCSGCSVSFLNTHSPGPAEFLTQYISLLFHSTISTATGETAMNVINKTIQTGEFYLITEGAMPAGMPEACKIGYQAITKLVAQAARKAKAVITIGTCASFGGIPASEDNPTGAVSVPDFLKKEGISVPTIRLPGCPCHPDWLVGTVVHVLSFGLPPMDESGRPLMFYNHLVHEQCSKFQDYEREKFAATFSGEGCLFKLGCLGPVTKADCPIRQWNSGVNTCIRAGAPCIGCASESFASSKTLPFYRKSESAA